MAFWSWTARVFRRKRPSESLVEEPPIRTVEEAEEQAESELAAEELAQETGGPVDDRQQPAPDVVAEEAPAAEPLDEEENASQASKEDPEGSFHVKQGDGSMPRILAIVNQKGGVGKTTTAVNLAASLAGSGKRVLLVDADPQGNATSGIGVEKSKLAGCIYDMLVSDKSIAEVVVPTQVEHLDLLPATIDLAGAEIELVSALSRESKLKYALSEVQDRYDFILIDSPPSLGLLTLNALTAAQGVLVPIQCEYYALEGIGQLINTLQLVRKHLNPALEVFGVVLTMYDPRTNLAQQVASEVRDYFGAKVFNTVIPRNIRLSEAPSHGLPISLYDPRSKGAEAYAQLSQEVINHG